MQTYIGTKIVNAEPMTKEEFELLKKHLFVGVSDYFQLQVASLRSRLSLEDGYIVIYEDGYKSWSPKDVFERSYRKVTSAEMCLVNSHPANQSK